MLENHIIYLFGKKLVVTAVLVVTLPCARIASRQRGKGGVWTVYAVLT